MTTLPCASLSAPRLLTYATGAPNHPPLKATWPNQPWTRSAGGRIAHARPVGAAPEKIAEKVEESIKKAEEACSGDPASGECVAAWDEVEELSAAASHARDKAKDVDPLEEYCKDNPETDECRTYED